MAILKNLTKLNIANHLDINKKQGRYLYELFRSIFLPELMILAYVDPESFENSFITAANEKISISEKNQNDY